MRMRLTRPSASSTFVGGALLLLTASAVWACTAQPRIFSLGPQVGPVGLEITLEGQAVGGAPVEVRWNSLEGAKIGEGTADFSGNFAVRAKIPQTEPGIYFLVVKGGDAGVVRSPFEVTSEQPVGVGEAVPSGERAASSTDLWSAFSAAPAGGDTSAAAEAAPSGSGTQALAGAALLAAGLAALASGLILSRRRSHASG